MRGISSHSHDPYFNLAAEEYLLKEYPSDCFMLYRNSKSVVVGKHQNTLAEVNYPYLRRMGIPVVRRLSGGGTVFHDLGNVNFLFIREGEVGKLVDFRRHLMPVLDILHQMSIPAEYGGRNDLLINGRKISGNAEHVYHNRTLHHGTLLFSSDLEMLEQAIMVKPGLYEDRAVRSVRSQVCNISESLNKQMPVDLFEKALFGALAERQTGTIVQPFTREETQAIEALAASRYKTWEWNFGYSPEFNYRLETGLRLVTITVSRGLVESIDAGKESHISLPHGLQNLLHKPFNEMEILECFKNYPIGEE